MSLLNKPGWYRHSERPKEEWYWDGKAWTKHRKSRRFLRGLREVLKYALLIVVVIVVAALIMVGYNKAGTQQSSEQGVSPTKVDLIAMGMTREQVKHVLGDPERTERRDVAGQSQSECWDYSVQGFRATQICFGGDDRVDYMKGAEARGDREGPE